MAQALTEGLPGGGLTATVAGSISDRRAVSVSPKNGVALAVFPLARAVLRNSRHRSDRRVHRLGQRLGPCDLSADGRAGLGFTPFFRQPWRADSKRRAARDASRHVSRTVASGRRLVTIHENPRAVSMYAQPVLPTSAIALRVLPPMFTSMRTTGLLAS